MRNCATLVVACLLPHVFDVAENVKLVAALLPAGAFKSMLALYETSCDAPAARVILSNAFPEQPAVSTLQPIEPPGAVIVKF